METLELWHVFMIVGGILASLGVYGFILWLSTKPAGVVNLLVALKSRFVIDYDKLADRQEFYTTDTNRAEPGAYQAEPDFTRTSTPGAEPSNALLTEYLAGLKRLDNPGVWRFSANRVADLIGGTRADVLALIREVRAEDDPEPADPLRVRDSQGERLISRA